MTLVVFIDSLKKFRRLIRSKFAVFGLVGRKLILRFNPFKRHLPVSTNFLVLSS